MAITVDSRNAGTNAAGVTSLSWSHTVGASLSNSILIVMGETNHSPNVSMSGVNWDDTGTPAALSKTINSVAAEVLDTGVSGTWASLWYLLAPVSGTKTIKITPASSADLMGGSASYAGVAQSGTFNAASPHLTGRGANTNPTTSVTSATGELVIDSLGVGQSGALGTITVGSGQTQIFQQNIGNFIALGAGSDEAGAATVTMDWTGMTVNTFGTAQVCVSLVPAAGGLTAAEEIPAIYQALSGMVIGRVDA